MTVATVPAGEAAPGTLVCPEPAERPDLWPWSARRRDDGVLEVGGMALTDIAADFATPVFVMDRADLRGRARVWATAMAEEFWDGYGMSGGDAYYAGKAFLCSHGLPGRARHGAARRRPAVDGGPAWQQQARRRD